MIKLYYFREIMNTGDSRASNDLARRFVDDMERSLLERSLLDRRFNAVEVVNTDDWERIFNAIEIDNSLSEHNVIDKIKEKLRDTSIVYKLWKMDNFNINYKFIIQHMYCSSKESLLDMAAVNRNPKILRTLLDKGADINVQVETALRGAP